MSKKLICIENVFYMVVSVRIVIDGALMDILYDRGIMKCVSSSSRTTNYRYVYCYDNETGERIVYIALMSMKAVKKRGR